MSKLEELRAAGWSVAVHNDYRLNGEVFTFWLLTHPNGHWVKGEGRTDDQALQQCLGAAQALSAPPGMPSAEELAASLTDLRGRIETVAHEAFGPFPVQSADEALTAIEWGIFEMRQASAALEREREELRRLLTEADKRHAVGEEVFVRDTERLNIMRRALVAIAGTADNGLRDIARCALDVVAEVGLRAAAASRLTGEAGKCQTCGGTGDRPYDGLVGCEDCGGTGRRSLAGRG